MSVDEHDTCPQCEGSYHVDDALLGREYQGFAVDDGELWCKACIERGVRDNTLRIIDIQPPRLGWFIVQALPHTNTHTPRMVTQSWAEVVSLMGTDLNRFRVAYLMDDLRCHGNYVVRALMGEGACNEYFDDEELWKRTYDEGLCDFYIYRNKRDREGVHLMLPENLEYEEYEDRITDIVNPMLNAIEHSRTSSIFIGTYEQSKALPHMLLKPVYYHPETSLKWCTSLQEVAEKWQDLAVMQPGQFTVERISHKKLKV